MSRISLSFEMKSSLVAMFVSSRLLVSDLQKREPNVEKKKFLLLSLTLLRQYIAMEFESVQVRLVVIPLSFALFFLLFFPCSSSLVSVCCSQSRRRRSSLHTTLRGFWTIGFCLPCLLAMISSPTFHTSTRVRSAFLSLIVAVDVIECARDDMDRVQACFARP
jgi:hypothetical protein